MGKHSPTRRVGGVPRRWNPKGLREYLRELQGRYRPPGRVFPRTPQELADEATQGIFNADLNADHILHLLVGHRGPWTSRDLPLGNLPFALNQYTALVEWNADQATKRRRLVAHNRRVQSVMNQVKALGFLSGEEDQPAALAILARQKFQLSGKPRSPKAPFARQPFMTVFVLQLVSYLQRTTREPDEPEGKEVFQMAARILHLASEGRYPDKWELVKQRWYRGMGLTKLIREQPKEWNIGGRVWKKGERVTTPEGVPARVIGAAKDEETEADLIEVALPEPKERDQNGRITKWELPPIGHPGAIGRYPPERLRPAPTG